MGSKVGVYQRVGGKMIHQATPMAVKLATYVTSGLPVVEQAAKIAPAQFGLALGMLVLGLPNDPDSLDREDIEDIMKHVPAAATAKDLWEWVCSNVKYPSNNVARWDLRPAALREVLTAAKANQGMIRSLHPKAQAALQEPLMILDAATHLMGAADVRELMERPVNRSEGPLKVMKAKAQQGQDWPETMVRELWKSPVLDMIAQDAANGTLNMYLLAENPASVEAKYALLFVPMQALRDAVYRLYARPINIADVRVDSALENFIPDLYGEGYERPQGWDVWHDLKREIVERARKLIADERDTRLGELKTKVPINFFQDAIYHL